jgi:hypothetical protein
MLSPQRLENPQPTESHERSNSQARRNRTQSLTAGLAQRSGIRSTI